MLSSLCKEKHNKQLQCCYEKRPKQINVTLKFKTFPHIIYKNRVMTAQSYGYQGSETILIEIFHRIWVIMPNLGIECSLKPITIIMVICGIPASHSTHRFFKFLFHIVVVLSLTINIHSNMNYLSDNLSKWIDEMMDLKLNDETFWNSTINGFLVVQASST